MNEEKLKREQKLFDVYNSLEKPSIVEIHKLSNESRDIVKSFLDRNYLEYRRGRFTVTFSEKGNIICLTCKKEKSPNKYKKNQVNYSAECNSCKRNKDYEKSRNTVEGALKRRINNLRSRAKRRGFPCTITGEDLIQQFHKQKGLCFYTEEVMNWKRGIKKLDHDTLTVDKIIPELGYVKGNVVLCTNKANHAKSFLTMEDLQKWVPLWYEKIVNFKT